VFSFSLLFLALCFTQIIHPIAILILLLASTSLIILVLLVLLTTAWLRYILFLIILGGLLILFIYIISLTPNSQIVKFSPLTLVIFFSLILLSFQPPHSKDYIVLDLSNELLTIAKIYFPSLMNIVLILAFILLFALLVIVYVAQFNKGALRALTYV